MGGQLLDAGQQAGSIRSHSLKLIGISRRNDAESGAQVPIERSRPKRICTCATAEDIHRLYTVGRTSCEGEGGR